MTAELDPAGLDVDAMRLRRTPRQARARQKLARVLEAADRLLAGEGPEALTTTRVAAAAGVSVGTLYQYLPDRDAIIDALADRYLTRLEALMDEFVVMAQRETWPDPVAVLVDAFADLYRSEPGFRALWFGRHFTERTREADRRHKRMMAAAVHRILVAQHLLPDDEAAATACFAGFLAADAVTQEAFRADPGGAADLLGQLKAMLRAYLDRLAHERPQAGAAEGELPKVNEKVLVTGGSGFVASHLVEQLLARGYPVNATVRSLANAPKAAPLLRLQDRHPGMLQLFEADLLRPGSFGAAMKDCRVVFHVASPFLMPERIKDGRKDVLEPAVQGMRNVLASINETRSVERLVLTSTVGAIFGDYIDVLSMKDQTLSEDYFNTTSTLENNPYHYAKTVAEREAWAAAGEQDRWSMVSLNPGLVLGPSFTPASDSGSLFLLDELLRGYFFYGAANFSFTVVDVRDLVLAHISAAEDGSASGRYIVAHQEMYSFPQMANIIRDKYPRNYRIPRNTVPDWVVRILGPRFGLTQQYISNHLGIRFAVDNSRSIKELRVSYRPVAETVLDHYASWRTNRSRVPAATS
ncbi:MAG TPA: NAD-dependent epimerase/dehydratase family protein [Streptosporangiaceae bacterium]|jgi:nucleoside-diphosphate-sugar epimerase/AcrR family transcriptional regulator|nr:NAD-dependent epimerase/dehydratase family protein [Streptosporangiaceae bacterium]